MKTLALSFALILVAVRALALPVVMVDTNGVLQHPTNLFQANISKLTNALESAGYSPGGSGGSTPNAATTNASQAFASGTTNTFNSRVDLKGETYVGSTNLIAKIIALDAAIAGKADADSDLTALAGLATTGVMVRTGAAAYALRAITGDAEIVFANGDGVAGNPTASIGAGIARVAAVAASYQPIATILSRLSGIGLGAAGDVIIRDTLGWTNLAKSTDGKVLKLVSGVPAWADDNTASGGTVATNQANAFDTPYRQTFNGPVSLNGTTDVATLNAATVIYAGIWPLANGGVGANTYLEARTNLQVVPDVHVMGFKLKLLQIDTALSGTGHVPRRVSSGIITNMTVDDAALALLAATTAAGQRSAIGAAGLAGDTFSGPVLVPYMPYNANHTNTGSNYVMTARAIAEKIEQITTGSTFFTGVNATNFTNNAGVLDFAPNATLGTGKLLRESAAGSTPALSGMSDVEVPQPGGGPGSGDILGWVGGSSKWGNIPNSKVLGNESWCEIFSEFAGNGSAQAIDPFGSANINNGSVTSGAIIGGRIGTSRLLSRLSSVDQWSGGNIGLSGTQFIPTNTVQWRHEFILLFTNQVTVFAGMYDDLTTNAPTDAIMLTVTNQVACFVAYAGGSKVVSPTTISLQTNTWYTALGTFTNGTIATLKLFTNRTSLAWSESLSSGLPYGEANALGFGIRANSTGPASTNGVEMVAVDRMGVRWTNPSN